MTTIRKPNRDTADRATVKAPAPRSSHASKPRERDRWQSAGDDTYGKLILGWKVSPDRDPQKGRVEVIRADPRVAIPLATLNTIRFESDQLALSAFASPWVTLSDRYVLRIEAHDRIVVYRITPMAWLAGDDAAIFEWPD